MTGWKGPAEHAEWMREFEERQQRGHVQMVRNHRARDLERAGYVDEAAELYEANVAEHFRGSRPYVRLATIYRKANDPWNEQRVLALATSLQSAGLLHHPKSGEFESQLQRSIAKHGRHWTPQP